MGFESGRISFQVFDLSGEWTPDILERFARHAAPPLESLGREPIEGWVSGRHLLDRRIEADNCLIASGYLHLNWMRAERKIPEALLRAHCRIEEEVELRARGLAALPRKVRAEIRAGVEERLLPDMPPTLTGIPVVIDFRNRRLLAGTISEKATDTLTQAVQRTTGIMPSIVTPETAALRRKQINVNDLDAQVFTPQENVEAGDWLLGDDFMTWLWFDWERSGGVFHIEREHQPFGYMLEGPLLFVHQAEGAHEAVLRKGSPLRSAESGTALWSGKKLRRATLVLAQGESTWLVNLDASRFSFGGLKLPDAEPQPDPIARFHARMLAMETFWNAFMFLFDRFLDLRRSADWGSECTAMQDWVARRANRATDA